MIHLPPIRQWPSLGVKTKNRKQSTTYLLDVPELLAVVQQWDSKVRTVLGDSGLWFAPLSNKTSGIKQGSHEVGKNRDARAKTDLRRWLEQIGMPYHHPHKFRHSYAVHALKLAQDMGDFKALSMNLMHSCLMVTDAIYSVLSEQDVSSRIASLGRNPLGGQSDYAKMLRDLADQLDAKR